MERVCGISIFFALCYFYCFFIIVVRGAYYSSDRKCTTTKDCYPLQTCKDARPEWNRDGYCYCPPDHILDSSEGCLPLRTQFGDDCKAQQQCSFETLGLHRDCVNNKCSCEEGAAPVNGKCYRAMRLHERCYQDENCQHHLGVGGQCSSGNGKCGCSTSSIYDMYTKKCFPLPSAEGTVRYGGECKNLGECMGDIKLAICSGRCTCQDGFIPSKKLDQCLPLVHKLGEECTQSEQCQNGNLGEFSSCEGGNPPACLCGAGGVYDLHREICVRKAVTVGDKCDIHLQCLAGLERAVCLRGACRCMEGTNHIGGKCVL